VASPALPASATLAERSLAERIRSGDVAAFEAMFWEHYDALCRFTSRYVGSLDAAEDIVQDVLFRMWEGRERLEVREDLKTYLYGAARNRALDYLRHQTVVRRSHGRVESSGDAVLRSAWKPEPPDAAVGLSELDAAIRRAIDRLPVRCRQTFMLSRDEGMTYAQVAAVMGVSVKTVKIQMGRALKVIRFAASPFLLLLIAVLFR
jgi:RNA polymerase sigma-70 factor (ECF subfamily)